MQKKLLLLAVFMTLSVTAQDYSGLIDAYFNQNRSNYNLQPQDVSDVHVYNQHFSKKANVNHVYTVQRYQGVEVFNSIANFAVRNNEIVLAKVGFVNQLEAKINTTSPSLSPQEAIESAVTALGLNAVNGLQQIEQVATNEFLYTAAGVSQVEIPVKMVLQPNEDFSSLRLAWDLSIYLNDSSHWYSVRVDAVTGELLQVHDWVAHCNFGIDSVHNHTETKASTSHFLFSSAATTPNDGSSYRVFPMPVESPNHGSESIETEPGTDIASPYGWHDTNGADGAEYTITRGNNVYARADVFGNNGGDSPDGGAGLTFEFPYNLNAPPSAYTEASTVNLFYWNNIIHDVWYQYGFDEESGNFQENNYGNGGLGSDPVNADAQDGSGMNNANFATPPDGQNPRMQMFLWASAGDPGDPLTINNSSLQGTYTGESAAFGAPLPWENPITADMVLVEDNNSGDSTDTYDGCDTITNSSDIAGKIAVIRRGNCEFGYKVLEAENFGALAVIVTNNEGGGTIAMGAGDVGDQVTIPAIMVNQSDGEAIIDALIDGETINATLANAGPFEKDGTIDNGIIAHEYGHGISNRLTAGPTNVGCLQNDEQMGEGWSDWVGLMMTIEPGDEGEDVRGIGTFATNEPVTGNGIRPAPYSTSFSVNSFTYAATNNGNISQPHGIGFVWATMLWDLNWAMIDEYGFDDDFYNGTGGNNMTMQLVMEGMKLQPCNPGFVTGRDAILEADELLYNGENRCLIWNVFARRGLGVNASQGSSFNRFDQEEDFDVPEDCALGTDGHSSSEFSIYPNPAEGIVNVYTSQAMGDASVTIYDINGREVLRQQITLGGIANVDISGIASGIYVVKVSNDAITHTAKLIVK